MTDREYFFSASRLARWLDFLRNDLAVSFQDAECRP